MSDKKSDSDPADVPGKEPEPAAASVPDGLGIAPLGQGAQVILTGDAQAAARGGLHDEIPANVEARDTAILAGHVAPGTTEAAVEDATGVAPVPPEPDPPAAA